MRQIFYQYASSTLPNPLVDRHDIEEALDAWSWYWIILEASSLTLVAGAVAVYFRDCNLLLWFGLVSMMLWLVASLYYSRIDRYTRPEVEKIAGDHTAHVAVKAVFDAL